MTNPYQLKKNNDHSFEPYEKLLSGILLLCIFVVYIPALQNGFTNWDDTWYVTENSLLSDFSFSGLAYWFTHYFHGQYSPIGNVVAATIYQFSGYQPFLYHFVSLLLHICNVFLVVKLIKKLTHNVIITYFVAFLFALHPLQTEAIAWFAAIKIPLYVFFTLIALLLYLKYIETGKIKWYLLAFIPFLLAFGSKEQALAIVGSIIFIDYFCNRNLLSRKVILEKIPWLILGILMGLNSIAATASFGIVTPAHDFGFNEQFLLPSVAFVTYLWKLMIPVGMTAIYPYPDITDQVFPWYYYLSVAAVIAVIGAFIYFRKKNKYITFGIGFFVANIILVLQIVPTRNVLIADRYVYLSSIGYFLILGWLFEKMLRRGSGWKIFSLAMVALWLCVLSVTTFSRNKVWRNTETMWTDVTKKQPDALIAWYNLAGYYFDNQEYEKAAPAYAEVLRVNAGYVNGLYNYGNTFFHLKKYNLAEQQNVKALTLEPNNYNSRMNLYMALMQQHKYSQAKVQIDILSRKYPNDKDVKSKKALLTDSSINQSDDSVYDFFSKAQKAFTEGDYMDAIMQYSRAIEKAPKNDNIYYNRGNTYFILSQWEKAIADYNVAIGLNNRKGDYYYNRALASQKLGNTKDCCSDLDKATALGNLNAKKKKQEFCP